MLWVFLPFIVLLLMSMVLVVSVKPWFSLVFLGGALLYWALTRNMNVTKEVQSVDQSTTKV